MAARRTMRVQHRRSQQAYARRKRKAQAQTSARHEVEVRQVKGLPVTHPHAAGIDIGSRTHWVCVGLGNDDSACIEEFPAHTEGLHQLLAFLRSHHVATVAMESTSIYWIPLYELLAGNGFEVLLVDPGRTKQVRGRPKTDRLDCQWIFRLHSCGLLAAAFRPDEKTCQLRSYLRQRANLIRYAGQHIQHMQSALEQMNLKLTEIINDITGVTGRAIIQAILHGTRDPHQLAGLRHERCHASAAEIAQALTGSYRDEHLFALRQAFAAWQFYQKQLDQADAQIQEQLGRMKLDRTLPSLPPPKRRSGRKPNHARFDVRTALYYVVGVDLTQIEGIEEMTALTIISEIGPDVSKFATVKHFCSWLGLCPQLKKTGGRVKSSRTRPGVNRVAAALRLAANGLHNSHGAHGAFLRRLKSRLGAPAAITATAHKMARLLYLALKHGMTYVRQSQEEYDKKIRERQIKSLHKRAKQLGFEVVGKTPPPNGASGSPEPTAAKT
jgi:transposase